LLAGTPILLTAEELSKTLPLHPETIRRWAREGRIPFRKLGRKIVFLASEITAWLESSKLIPSVVSPQLEREAA